LSAVRAEEHPEQQQQHHPRVYGPAWTLFEAEAEAGRDKDPDTHGRTVMSGRTGRRIHDWKKRGWYNAVVDAVSTGVTPPRRGKREEGERKGKERKGKEKELVQNTLHFPSDRPFNPVHTHIKYRLT